MRLTHIHSRAALITAFKEHFIEHILHAERCAGGGESGGEQDRADPLFSFFLEEPGNTQVHMSSDNKSII